MVSLRPARVQGTIVLSSGRHLGYAEYGPSSGRPLVWFHGTPGARGQISPGAREAAEVRGVRIIAVERPGIGSSTPHLYDAVLDFAHDVEQLCDALELERLAIAGLSGGGPYALACAHEMPGRVVAAGVLGGVAPSVGDDNIAGGVSELTRFFSPIFALGHRPLGVALRGLVRALEPLTDAAINTFAAFMPPGDKRVFEDEAVRKMFAQDLLQGSEHHMQAIFCDAVLFGRHWGFALADIETPIHMWYGDADNIVPISHGEHMADRLPNAVFRVRKEEGHLGGLGASDEILDALLGEFDAADEGRREVPSEPATGERAARPLRPVDSAS